MKPQPVPFSYDIVGSTQRNSLKIRRMTRMNFRFPYADQVVERYEKTTTEFTQFPLSQGSCKSSQVIFRLLLLNTQQQASTK